MSVAKRNIIASTQDDEEDEEPFVVPLNLPRKKPEDERRCVRTRVVSYTAPRIPTYRTERGARSHLFSPSERSRSVSSFAHRLMEAVKANFLFSHLTSEKRQTVFSLMDKMFVHEGQVGHYLTRILDGLQSHLNPSSVTLIAGCVLQVIIKQGERGDKFYVVLRGDFDVFLTQKDGDNAGKQIHIHTYTSKFGTTSPCFGELALMCVKPRARAQMLAHAHARCPTHTPARALSHTDTHTRCRARARTHSVPSRSRVRAHVKVRQAACGDGDRKDRRRTLVARPQGLPRGNATQHPFRAVTQHSTPSAR
jgi:hypothetical protein